MKEEILKLRSEGKTYNEIVDILGCSKSTVSFHCGNRMTDKELSEHRTKVQNNKVCRCGKPKSAPATVCNDCRREREQNSWKEMTLGEKIYDDHKYAKYSYVRYHARTLAKKLFPNECSNCGYDKHVECCHIKPICDFDPNTKLVVINDPSNLVLLCPNCHWEFDNGILSL